ncbi:hypothetical protein CHS0354_014645 [Potamilus streckersoni]|uniref:Uncharacterized protein n=1 Tax=Potamilus streckersoni TaxID=2493646 RepID=A0AAE0SQI1_9BIVA|nr:hypothetical protein CHS0354_014645 [Potamilus streckersoni]
MCLGSVVKALTGYEKDVGQSIMVNRTYMRMLCSIHGKSLKEGKRNEDIRQIVGIACITNMVREDYGGMGKWNMEKKTDAPEVYGQRSLEDFCISTHHRSLAN